MSKFQVAYIPIGVPTFHLESAQVEFDNSIAMLKDISADCVFPDKMLLSLPDLTAFLETINPDLIVLQNNTFANAAYASEVLKRFTCPVLLWTLREPVIDGGRLRLNSLTGAYSAANAIREFRSESTTFPYIFGAPTEDEVKGYVKSVITAAKIKKEMRSLKLASIGHTPQGFGFGRAMDADIMKHFGVTLLSLEARELINRAKGYSKDDCKAELDIALASTCGLSDTPAQNLEDFTKLFKAYKDYVTEEGIGAVSSRCWPDFFTDFGTPVCTVLGMLNDMGVVASCESDTYGALSMFIGAKMTDKAVFFGDPVSMDEKEGSLTFWHCGTASTTLARKDTGAQVGVHCNRKIGPTLEFGCEATDKATIFRIGKDAHGKFRFFVSPCSVMDKPKQFSGCSLVVKTETAAKEVLYKSVTDGWEPHFVVVYGDVKQELIELGNMLDIEVLTY